MLEYKVIKMFKISANSGDFCDMGLSVKKKKKEEHIHFLYFCISWSFLFYQTSVTYVIEKIKTCFYLGTWLKILTGPFSWWSEYLKSLFRFITTCVKEKPDSGMFLIEIHICLKPSHKSHTQLMAQIMVMVS